MKIFLVMFSVCALAVQGQIKNAGFEDWHPVPNTGGAEDPDFWESNNKALDSTTGFAVSKSTEANNGQYALKITPLKTAQKQSMITLGELNLDTMGNSGWTDCSGDSISFLPYILTGHYQYVTTKSNEQKAEAYFGLKKRKCISGSRVDPAHAFHSFQSKGDVYTPFAIPLYVAVDSMPPIDIFTISFYFPDYDTTAQNSYLLIDELQLVGRLSDDPEYSSTNPVGVFPNPVSKMLHIEIPPGADMQSVKLFDSQGRMFLEQESPGTELDLSHLPKGTYLLTLHTSGGDYFEKIQKN